MSNFRTLHPRVADSILTVDNLAELVLIGDPQEGDIRYVKDIDALYTFNGLIWSLSDTGVAGPSPAASTDEAIVRWDGSGATTLQNSSVLISDSGVITGVDTITAGNVYIAGETITSTSANLSLSGGPGSVYVTSTLALREGKDIRFFDDTNTGTITVSIPAIVSTPRSPLIPDDTGNFVLTSAAQTLTGKTFDADGAGNTLSNISNTNIKVNAAIDYAKLFLTANVVNTDISATAAIAATKIANGTVSNTEFQYLGGVTSAIQTQLNTKVAGPPSATDNAIARFDLTTGKLVQNSAVTISDIGAVNIDSSDTTAALTVGNTSTTGRGISISHTGNGATGRSIDITQNGTATAIQVNKNHAGANGRYGLALNSRDSGAGAGALTGQAIGSGALSAGTRGHLTDATVVRTGTTATSITVTGLSQTLDLAVGYSVSGTGIQAGSTIASIIDATSITLSLAATASASVSLTFTFAGNGLALFGFNLSTGAASKALALSNHSSGSHVGFNAPASAFTSYAMTYPNAQGAINTVLRNDGSGNLTWSPVATNIVGTEGDIGTLTWAATTAPSGTITQRYKYTRVGGTVTLSWRIEASVAGLAVTSVSFDLPGDVPSPTNFSNQSNDEWVTISGGAVLSTASAVLINGAAAGLYKNSGGTYEIRTYSGTVSVAAQFVAGTVTYQVDA